MIRLHIRHDSVTPTYSLKAYDENDVEHEVDNTVDISFNQREVTISNLVVHSARLPHAKPVARHPSSERFHEVLRGWSALHDRKQRDYGLDTDPFHNVRASEEWGIQGWVGALLRLSDKVRRLQKAAKGGTLEFEGVTDSLDDIGVYAGIARVLYEQTQADAAAAAAVGSGMVRVSGGVFPVGDLRISAKQDVS